MEAPYVQRQANPKLKGGRGKKKKRSEIKELLMLFILSREGPVGRYRLKAMLNLLDREGVVRSMLTDLAQQGYLEVTKFGCSLTQKGQILLETRFEVHHIMGIKPFSDPHMMDAPTSVAVHLHNRVDKVKSAMELRDLAVRVGASGATVVFYEKEKLTLPSVNADFFSDHPKTTLEIYDSFDLEDNDVLVFIFAEDPWRGFEASIAIALALS